jgi:tripartite-type tricarboxylate transporter receptor subunit TctC
MPDAAMQIGGNCSCPSASPGRGRTPGMKFWHGMLIVAAAAAVSAGPGRAGGTVDYPQRPITLVVPGPVGGTTDSLCRFIADGLRVALGKPAVVENRPGAIGSIGASAVAVAQPDGHTLLCTPDSPIVHSPLVNRSLPYDARTFVPVVPLAAAYSVIAVRRDLLVNTVTELIGYARANPGKINYASGGNGSGSQLATSQFACSTGIEMVNIPYQGSAPSQRALIGGEVDILIDGLPVLLPAFRAGLAKIIAAAAPARLAELPDTQTLAEVGLGNIELLNWFGIFAPRGSPALIIAKLNGAVNGLLGLPAVRARFEAWAVTPLGGTPEDFAELVKRDRQQKEDVIGRRCARDAL